MRRQPQEALKSALSTAMRHLKYPNKFTTNIKPSNAPGNSIMGFVLAKQKCNFDKLMRIRD